MRERLDSLLVRLGYFESREKAKATIMAGLVYVDKQRCDKAGTQVKDTVEIEVRKDLCPYVGRGGLKLDKALDYFQIDLSGYITMDMGASTGGFTDCMLQKGAEKVYAVDVGYGQLHYKLRSDPRVVNIERTNIRYLEPDTISEKLDFITIDVSFISVNLIFPVAKELLKENGQIVCLIKPQFEAGKEQVGKHGLVKDKAVHVEVIEKVIKYGENNGLKARGLTWSPITGAKGNIEYLILLKKTGDDPVTFDLEKTINSAIDYFKQGNCGELSDKE